MAEGLKRSPLLGDKARVFSQRKPVLEMMREIWEWRYLLTTLVLGRIKSDKRNTVLGNIWHLLNPIIHMLIFLFVYVGLFKGKQPNYPLFFFTGIVFYRFITNCFAQSSNIFFTDAELIKTCVFPRLLIVFACVLTDLYYMLVEWGIVGVMLCLYRVNPGWQIISLLPFTGVVTLGVLGLVMIISCAGVRYPDLPNVIIHVNRLLFYFTPVMYPLSQVKQELRWVYLLNPVSAAIETAHRIFLGQALDLRLFAYVVVFSVALFFWGLLIFSKYERKISKLI